MNTQKSGAGAATLCADTHYLPCKGDLRKIILYGQAGIEKASREADCLFNVEADRQKLGVKERIQTSEFVACSIFQNGLDSTAVSLRSHAQKYASALGVSICAPINDRGAWLLTKSGLRGRVFYAAHPDDFRKSRHRFEGYWLFGDRGVWMKLPATILRGILRRSGKLNGRERLTRNGLRDIDEVLLYICYEVVVDLTPKVIEVLKSRQPSVRDVVSLRRLSEPKKGGYM